MMHILLYTFLSGIGCQTLGQFNDFPMDELVRDWVNKDDTNLGGSEAAPTNNDQLHEDSFQPIEDYLHSLEIIDRPMEDYVQPIKDDSHIIENYLQSLESQNEPIETHFQSTKDFLRSVENQPIDNSQRLQSNKLENNHVALLSSSKSHATSTSVRQNDRAPTFDIQHPIQKKRPYKSPLVGIDLHQRRTIGDTVDPYARLQILNEAFLRVMQINALQFGAGLNRYSRAFLTKSVIPILGCVKHHFNNDAARFIGVLHGRLQYYNFKNKKCHGTPGKCTLQENVDKHEI